MDNEAAWKAVQADPSKDDYDAKRFQDIWEESVRMVPDAERRLKQAVQDLAAHVQQQEHSMEEQQPEAAATAESEWLPVAKELLQTHLPTSQSTAETGGVGGETTNVDDLAEGEAF